MGISQTNPCKQHESNRNISASALLGMKDAGPAWCFMGLFAVEYLQGTKQRTEIWCRVAVWKLCSVPAGEKG